MHFQSQTNARSTLVLIASLFLASSLPTEAQAQPTEEVPFITSPDNVTLEMLNAAGVKRGDHVIDLGSVGLEKSRKVHLWTVPARVDGLWCATGLLRGASIRLTQRYQTFEGVLAWRDRTRDLVGTINGTELRVPAGNNGELVLQATDHTLRITTAQGNLALVQGQIFTRTTGASCG